MKTKILLFLLVLCLNFGLRAQGVLNGGFETYSYTSGCATDDFIICQAPNWHVLNNTPDVLHSSNSLNNDASHVPRTGNGNARFASPPNGMDEYFYGATDFSLTAGQTYVVSFWVRKDYTTSANIPMGMYIGSSIPSPQLLNPYIQTTVPQIVITPTTMQYVKASTCFTPTTSGVHYLSFGAFGGNGTGQGQVWLIDDISVRPLALGEGLQDANIALSQSVYCVGDAITADGSASINEIEYSWSIGQIEQNGSETNVYTGTIQAGQAGTFNVSQILAAGGYAQPGRCFRIHLKVLNACTDQTTIDFCYDDPRFQFIGAPPVVCENVPIQLEVSGDDGWQYAWSTGQSGTGEKIVTVTPTAPSAAYTVTVTTPAGCHYTQTMNLTVSSLVGQVPPTMDGIDGSNGYTYYVNAGQSFNFTSTVFNNAGELVTYVLPTNLPSGFSVSPPSNNSNGGIVTFHGQTGMNAQGVYDVVLNMIDNNGCLAESNSYTFHVIVVCPTCPICWDYENRTPDHNPLAPENHMAKCIQAGITEPVVIGAGNNVLFQAGESIDLGTFFDTDGGTFEALISPTTCIDECDDCCDNWHGFTYDWIPPTVYVETMDDDPTNDFWQLTDSEHALCSFGIMGYHLKIEDAESHPIEDYEYHADNCCSFQSPSPDAPWVPYSEIHWDNCNHVGVNQGHFMGMGDFYVVLTLFGCNGQQQVVQVHISLNYGAVTGMAQQPGSELTDQQRENLVQASAQLAVTEQLKKEISLFPNPAKDRITVQGLTEENTAVQLYDEKGVMLSNRTALDASGSFDVTNLSAGTYYLRVYTKGTYVAKKFTKL